MWDNFIAILSYNENNQGLDIILIDEAQSFLRRFIWLKVLFVVNLINRFNPVF